MKVYVVTHGEKHEGGSVVGVLDTLGKARELAVSQRMCWPDQGWREDSLNKNYWENGCDYVLVQEFEVT